MKFYKRNAQGKPIFWEISDSTNKIVVTYGLVGKLGHTTEIRTNRQLNEEIKSCLFFSLYFTFWQRCFKKNHLLRTNLNFRFIY